MARQRIFPPERTPMNHGDFHGFAKRSFLVI
jgi:hypothetical protein